MSRMLILQGLDAVILHVQVLLAAVFRGLAILLESSANPLIYWVLLNIIYCVYILGNVYKYDIFRKKFARSLHEMSTKTRPS